MRRDMDLIRQLLLEIQNGKSLFNTITKDIANVLEVHDIETVTQEQADKVEHHLKLLDDKNFIEGLRRIQCGYELDRLTWAGHDFLDDISDPEIWKKTKDIAKKSGSFSLDVLKTIATELAVNAAKALI